MNRFLPLEMEEGEMLNETENENENQDNLQQRKRRCQETIPDETQSLVLHSSAASDPMEFSPHQMTQLLIEHSHLIQSLQLHVQHLEEEIQSLL